MVHIESQTVVTIPPHLEEDIGVSQPLPHSFSHVIIMATSSHHPSTSTIPDPYNVFNHYDHVYEKFPPSNMPSSSIEPPYEPPDSSATILQRIRAYNYEFEIRNRSTFVLPHWPHTPAK